MTTSATHFHARPITVIILLCLAMVSAPALACSCTPAKNDKELQQAVAEVEHILEGEVVDITAAPGCGLNETVAPCQVGQSVAQYATIKVHRVTKGKPLSYVAVYLGDMRRGQSEAGAGQERGRNRCTIVMNSCRVRPDIGETAIWILKNEAGRLRFAHECIRSRVAQALDKGLVPTKQIYGPRWQTFWDLEGLPAPRHLITLLQSSAALK